jgi:hypothetical protein
MASTTQKKPGRPKGSRPSKTEPGDLPKLSDTLMDFAEPILNAIPGEPTIEFVRAALTLATVAWNLPLLEDQGGAAEFGQARQDLERTLAAAPPAAAALLERMMQDRRKRYKTDTRLINDFKVKLDGDAILVTAYGTLLAAKRS